MSYHACFVAAMEIPWSLGTNDFSTLASAMLDCTVTINNVSPKYAKERSEWGMIFSSYCEYNPGKDHLKLEMICAELQSRKSWKNLTKMFDVNQCNQFGYTLLHYACLYDRLRSVRHLLQEEADVHVCDMEGNQPLHIAAVHSSLDIVKRLLRHGSNGLTRNGQGRTALEEAVVHKRLDVVLTMLHYLKPFVEHQPLCIALGNPNQEIEVSGSPTEHLPLSMSVDHLQEAVAPLLLQGAFVNFENGVILQKVIKSIVGNFYISTIVGKRKASLCHLISAGAKFAKKDGNTDIINFERSICSEEDMDLVRYLVESGYRFGINLEIPKYLEEVQSEPYTLQCLAAQTIRTCLIPNAWVGIKKLQFPSQLKKHIVMYTTYVEV